MAGEGGGHEYLFKIHKGEWEGAGSAERSDRGVCQLPLEGFQGCKYEHPEVLSRLHPLHFRSLRHRSSRGQEHYALSRAQGEWF